MTVETWFRIIFALVAIGMAIMLMSRLATGRAHAAGQGVDRRSAPRAYWGAVGMNIVLMLAFAIATILPREDYRPTIIILGLLGGQLVEMLVSGAVHKPAPATRAGDPRAWWRRVALQLVLIAAVLTILVLQLLRTP